MTWFETPHGEKTHFVPFDNNVMALCGVRADVWDPDQDGYYSARTHCATCEQRKQRIEQGRDDEYEAWEVL